MRIAEQKKPRILGMQSQSDPLMEILAPTPRLETVAPVNNRITEGVGEEVGMRDVIYIYFMQNVHLLRSPSRIAASSAK